MSDKMIVLDPDENPLYFQSTYGPPSCRLKFFSSTGVGHAAHMNVTGVQPRWPFMPGDPACYSLHLYLGLDEFAASAGLGHYFNVDWTGDMRLWFQGNQIQAAYDAEHVTALVVAELYPTLGFDPVTDQARVLFRGAI